MTTETTIETVEISGTTVIIRGKVTYSDDDGVEITHTYTQRNIGSDDDYEDETDRVQAAVLAARTVDSE